MSSVYSTGYCGMGEWGRLQVEEYESVLVTLAALKIFIPTNAPLNIFSLVSFVVFKRKSNKIQVNFQSSIKNMALK